MPADMRLQQFARQRRRRTRPEDQATLEAEYQRNPKPDRAARADIISRVLLGEKEVQIWFQNRRQVDRRKSQPAICHEILPNIPSSQDSTNDTASSSFTYGSSSQGIISSSQSSPDNSQATSNGITPRALADKTDCESGANSCATKSIDQAHEIELDKNPLRSHLSDDIDPNSFRAPPPPVSLSLSRQKRGRPTKTRYSSFTLFDEHQAAPAFIQSSLNQPSILPSSKIRLTTSLDGSVHVKTGSSPTSSPPRLQSTPNVRQPRSAAPLQRSQSAIEPSTFPRPAAPIGRSRDSRAWEFYCDSDIRDELTKQADLEQSGSAAGAIGLIRSRSKSSVVGAAANANPNKRNANPSRPESLKRHKFDGLPKGSKPKLERALSSVARLQNGSGNVIAVNNTEQSRQTKKASEYTDQEKKPSSTLTEAVDGNESDKENWKPGTQNVVSPRRRRPNTASRTRVLAESKHIHSHSSSQDPFTCHESSANRSRHELRAVGRGKENEPEMDEEVVAWMGNNNGESGDSLTGGEVDLDCVQGLLSLRRGLWR